MSCPLCGFGGGSHDNRCPDSKRGKALLEFAQRVVDMLDVKDPVLFHGWVHAAAEAAGVKEIKP